MISNKYNYMYNLAKELQDKNKTITGANLAEKLNTAGYKTTYNSSYKGGRGTYRCAKACYQSFLKHDGNADRAGYVANAFVTETGDPAWK